MRVVVERLQSSAHLFAPAIHTKRAILRVRGGLEKVS